MLDPHKKPSPNGRQALLLVDDEEKVLSALQRALRKETFPVFTARDGWQALDILSQHPIAVIVSDYCMPGMDGIELLREVHRCYPSIVRILLSGHANRDTVVSAVNEGEIFKVLIKPWNIHLLRDVIHEAYRKYTINRETENLAHSLQQANDDLHILNDTLKHRIAEKSTRLARAICHDALTGIPNRAYLINYLNRHISNLDSVTQDDHHTIGALIIGLDHFKLINESLGPLGGDELLCLLAKRLTNIVRESDLVARISGDEFCFITTGIKTFHSMTMLAQHILEAVNQPFNINQQEIFTTGSIGISLYPKDGLTSEELTKAASSAMHLAKQKGGNCYTLYSSKLNEQANRRISIASGLYRALERARI